MTIITKNNIISALLASACGIITADLFFRLYGIVIVYIGNPIIVKVLKYFCGTAYGRAYWWLHYFIFETLVLVITIIIIGCIIGAFLKIDKIIASIIAFICFELTKAFMIYKVLSDFSVFSPIIHYLLISAVAFCLFWYSFYLGGIVRKKMS
jgi:hypothetical protein